MHCYPREYNHYMICLVDPICPDCYLVPFTLIVFGHHSPWQPLDPFYFDGSYILLGKPIYEITHIKWKYFFYCDLSWAWTHNLPAPHNCQWQFCECVAVLHMDILAILLPAYTNTNINTNINANINTNTND